MIPRGGVCHGGILRGKNRSGNGSGVSFHEHERTTGWNIRWRRGSGVQLSAFVLGQNASGGKKRAGGRGGVGFL